MDGRRVGYEIKLCRDVGGRKIPCTKRELRQKLEGINFFTETQREYMELVNRYLFGFPCVEQYQQMIRLLVKVRAPKLSKELSPSKVYEVLKNLFGLCPMKICAQWLRLWRIWMIFKTG